MDKIRWTDRVRKEKSSNLTDHILLCYNSIEERKGNKKGRNVKRIGLVLRGICLPHHIIERKIERRIKVTER
jgi:hypothetical protein